MHTKTVSLILFMTSSCSAFAQVPCDPNIARCPTNSTQIDAESAEDVSSQAPAGLDQATQKYYANRRPRMQLSNQHKANLERDLRLCLPPSYRGIMRRVVRHESGNNPFAVNINQGPKLTHQPKTAQESARIARTYIAKGYSVDMGYAQINSQHYANPNGFLKRAGYGVEDMLDPCTNLRAGALILGEAYLRYHDIKKALSVYNTGNTTKGLTNGYVDKVLKGK